jgi:hypothetical protein
VANELGSGVRQGISSELTWTLRRLEAIAVRPVEQIGADAAPELARLQYSLHLLGERLHGLRPTEAHAELADALERARDATADVAEAAEAEGWAGAAPLVYEWRGALFRLRLARTMLTPPRPEPQPPAQPDVRAALASFGLTLAGGAAFVSGAVVATWPLWAAGMVAVVAGLLVYRP